MAGNRDDFEDAEDDVGLSLEKLNLGPKKKLLVISPSGVLIHRAHLANNSSIPNARTPDAHYGGHLGPKGELAKYLEGLAEADDVQSHVKENPFGQPAVNPSHPDWGFYCKVIRELRRE
ncbi:hypothetical protein Patl1_32357 [Pistacia atlantica]|uniref:Uncharacterized protein n=1 Tax=Pistacia atlantica TaxID=434234 RepID=A0ACC1APW7_9ROSI|nr:hypothetical protein Patl1_32357 [Pistacia atlantica]